MTSRPGNLPVVQVEALRERPDRMKRELAALLEGLEQQPEQREDLDREQECEQNGHEAAPSALAQRAGSTRSLRGDPRDGDAGFRAGHLVWSLRAKPKTARVIIRQSIESAVAIVLA